MRAMMTLVLLAVALPAHGRKQPQTPPRIAGDYDVTFKQVANSCTQGGINLTRGTLNIWQKESRIEVTVPITATMRGSVDRKGKFKARAKRGGTAIRGVEGEFAVAGSVKSGKLELTLAAQYYTDGKPFCQQTWNASGKRSQ